MHQFVVKKAVPDSVAFTSYKSCALSASLVIHDVPSYWTFMYQGTLYQLHTRVTCCASVSELREITADYLKSHSDFYKDFICKSVASSNPMNADTEPPSAQINLFKDPYDCLQAC